MTLGEASLAKLELICDKLGLSSRDHLVEIGTGWGGLAVHAARTRGCRVTTTTISREQYEYARSRVAASGLWRPGQRGLRGLPRPARPVLQAGLGRDDRGRRLAGFRNLLRSLLPSAEAATATCCSRRSSSTTAPTRSRRPRASFIRNYVFPGGCLPSLEVIGAASCTYRLESGRARRPDSALRLDAAPLAWQLRGGDGPPRRARLRRALPAPMEALSVVLRGRVRRAPDRARAVDMAKPGWRPRAPQPWLRTGRRSTRSADVSANTRLGLPVPPTSFSGETTIIAPVVGRSLRGWRAG